MKIFLFTINYMLFFVLIVHAQSNERMYKKWLAGDSINKNKPYNNVKTAAINSADTAKVIGFATAPLYKKQPESPLGNFMADCMKMYAEKYFGKPADAAFVNISGIRSYIAKGDITVGALYKVMPYDNQIVLIEIKGNILKQFLDHQASLGGWPCAGISMIIKNKMATSILINKKPLSDTAVYTIAAADYIANGGNQCTMLKGLPQLKNNYLFRDALIDYVSSFTKEGKPVSAVLDNRIVNSSE